MRRTTTGLALLCALTLASAGAALTAPQEPKVESIIGASHRLTLTLDGAKRAAAAAAAYARSHGAGGSIAIVDDGGHLIYLERLDDTFPASAEVAIAKARTAAVFRRPTRDFENAIRAGRTPLLSVEPMTPLEGGVPILIEGRVVGAVGVSGAMSSTQDVEIAEAGASALQ